MKIVIESSAAASTLGRYSEMPGVETETAAIVASRNNIRPASVPTLTSTAVDGRRFHALGRRVDFECPYSTHRERGPFLTGLRR